MLVLSVISIFCQPFLDDYVSSVAVSRFLVFAKSRLWYKPFILNKIKSDCFYLSKLYGRKTRHSVHPFSKILIN